MNQFEAGKTYNGKSIFDHQDVFTFTVASRSAKFVTLADEVGKLVRCAIRVRDGSEYCTPFGSYSMAPVLWSVRP